MVLESTVICLDNSEWMRNGDYVPSRIEAQQDAAGIICNTRTESHPENTIGLLSMAGKGVELLVSPTEDIAKILAAFSKINIGGKADFCNAVQIAQLSLKHRKNKNGGQRIIAFVGSPLHEDKKTLQKVGKQLKKNNVAIDVISMGEIEENQEKLLELVNATNSNDNSHLITVPPGVQPVDALMASPVMIDSGMGIPSGAVAEGSASGAAPSNTFAEYGGVDPSLDPELAMAIRASTEEARAREEARLAAAPASSNAASSTSDPSATATISTPETPLPSLSQLHLGGADEDEDSLLQRALELSMREMAEATLATTGAPPAGDVEMTVEEDEEDSAMRLALELSMQQEATSEPTVTTAAAQTKSEEETKSADLYLDPAFVSQLLGSVDVDTEDPLIKAALAQINASGATSGAGAEETKDSRKRKEGPGQGDDNKDGST